MILLFVGVVSYSWARSEPIGRLSRFNGSDMLLHNSRTGRFEVYDICNNNITNAAFLGTVGMDWQVMGFGNFGSRSTSDVILRNTKTGGLEVYDTACPEARGKEELVT